MLVVDVLVGRRRRRFIFTRPDGIEELLTIGPNEKCVGHRHTIDENQDYRFYFLK